MTWWTKFQRRRQLEKDLTDEIAFHRAMRQGDANAPSFGNETRIRETTRDLWRFGWIETAWHDTRDALRTLRRQPGFAAIVILTLALGIGANTAVFSVLNGVVLRPLPYPDPDRLEFVTTQFPGLGFDTFAMSLPELLELREHTRAFAAVGGYVTGTATFGGLEPTRQDGAGVTPGLFEALGVRPALGRSFIDDDFRPGADPVVLISDALWHREFGGDVAAVGRRVEVDGASRLIIGVMPDGFDVRVENHALWVPVTIDPAQLIDSRSNHFLDVIARRLPDVAHVRAQADIDRLMASWRQFASQGHIPTDPGHRLAIAPLGDEVIGEVRGTLWLLQASVGLVLLIACVNLASLLMARADSRAQEHALRAALGASRGRLLRQMITEGLLLAGLAAVAGAGLAHVGLSLLLSSYPDVLPRVREVGLDARVLAFTAGVTLVVALVFGLVPFAHLAKDRIGQALRFASHRMTAGTARARVRTALVVAEVTLAVLLVTGAGLLLRSFINLNQVDVGFDRAGLSSFALQLPSARYDATARARFYEALIERIGSIPGVRGVATMTGLPTQRDLNANDTDFAIIPNDGSHDELPAENVDYYQTVSLGYADTLGVRIVDGRGFEPADVGGAPAVLVNEALVRKFFQGRDPIGQQVRRGFEEGSPWYAVVGVLEDIKHDGVAADAGTELYFLADQQLRLNGSAPGGQFVAVRADLPLAAIAPRIRRTIAELDPSLPITAMQTMDESIGASIARPRFLLLLLGLMAALALALAAVGIYGILAYLVTERRREIGIRMALGATRGHVVGIVLARGLGATAVGLACGLLASLALTGLLATLLFGVAPNDPLTLAGVAGLILIVAAGACAVPAWRASRVNPITALRS